MTDHLGLDDIIALAEDGRVADAIAALDAVIAEVNDDARLHALRAFFLLDVGRVEEARRAAELARALDDEDTVPLYALARAALAAGEPAEAIRVARETLALAPDDHEAIIVEAHARAMLGQWDEVASRAEYVLTEDPHNAEAAFLRIAAIQSRENGGAKLDEAEWTRLAERFPHVAIARTGRGWAHLHRGRAGQAESEFRDALALDPGASWAKEGLVLALKARYPGYTLLLRFFFWLQSLPPGMQTAFVIGGVVGSRVLRGVADAYPALAPFITPIIYAYIAFVLLTWLADPLLNLTLLARAEGRRLLSPDDRRGAVVVGTALATGLVLMSIGALASDDAAFGAGMAVGFTSLLFAAAFACAPGKQRAGLLTVATTFVALGLASMLVPASIGPTLVVVVAIGVVIGTWVSRPLIRKSYERALR